MLQLLAGNPDSDGQALMLEEVERLAEYAQRLIADLENTVDKTSQRLVNVSQRAEEVRTSKINPLVSQLRCETGKELIRRQQEKRFKPTRGFGYTFSDVLKDETRSSELTALRDACKPPPDFTVFEKVSPGCSLKFSNPAFFYQEWSRAQNKQNDEEERKRSEEKKVRKFNKEKKKKETSLLSAPDETQIPGAGIPGRPARHNVGDQPPVRPVRAMRPPSQIPASVPAPEAPRRIARPPSMSLQTNGDQALPQVPSRVARPSSSTTVGQVESAPARPARAPSVVAGGVALPARPLRQTSSFGAEAPQRPPRAASVRMQPVEAPVPPARQEPTLMRHASAPTPAAPPPPPVPRPVVHLDEPMIQPPLEEPGPAHMTGPSEATSTSMPARPTRARPAPPPPPPQPAGAMSLPTQDIPQQVYQPSIATKSQDQGVMRPKRPQAPPPSTGYIAQPESFASPAPDNGFVAATEPEYAPPPPKRAPEAVITPPVLPLDIGGEVERHGESVEGTIKDAETPSGASAAALSDPVLSKFAMMQKMNMPQGAIEQAMIRANVDPALLFGESATLKLGGAGPGIKIEKKQAQAPAVGRPASIMDEIAQGGRVLRKVEAPSAPAMATASSSNELMQGILSQREKLKKVEAPPEAEAKPPSTSHLDGGGVASILARRIAIIGDQGSDDDDSGGSEWDSDDD